MMAKSNKKDHSKKLKKNSSDKNKPDKDNDDVEIEDINDKMIDPKVVDDDDNEDTNEENDVSMDVDHNDDNDDVDDDGEDQSIPKDKKRDSISSVSSKQGKDKNNRNKRKSIDNTPKESRIIYIGHLPKYMEEHEIYKFLQQFGNVKNLYLFRSKKTGNSKGYTFVQFYDSEIADIVANTLSGYIIMGTHRLMCHVMSNEKCIRMEEIFNKKKSGGINIMKHDIFEKIKNRKKLILNQKLKRKSTIDRIPIITNRLLQRQMKQTLLLKQMGIEYDFPGYEAEKVMIPKKLITDTTNEEQEEIGNNDNKTMHLKNIDSEGKKANDNKKMSKKDKKIEKNVVEVEEIDNKESMKEDKKQSKTITTKNNKKRQHQENNDDDDELPPPIQDSYPVDDDDNKDKHVHHNGPSKKIKNNPSKHNNDKKTTKKNKQKK